MRSDWFTGQYLFHMHTTHTDGQLAVGDYFKAALDHRLDRLIFLEHIRRIPLYSVAEFIREVRMNATESGMEAHIGFETKILPDGTLDISEEDFRRAEVIGIAEHSFPDDPELYFKSLRSILNTVEGGVPDKEIVWVHPGLWLHKRGLMETFEHEHLSDLQAAGRAGIRLEHNCRYNLVSPTLLTTHAHIETIVGADAHTGAELRRFWNNWLSSEQGKTPNLSV
jgi:histidinol phosphatase-like PHP family hydrolase